MLIYARIMLALMFLSCLFQIIAGGYATTKGILPLGAITVISGLLFAWLSYTNFKEAQTCVSDKYPGKE